MDVQIKVKSNSFSSYSKCCICNKLPCNRVKYQQTLIDKLKREWLHDNKGNFTTVNKEIVLNKTIRHFLYKQYTMIRYGVIGRGKHVKLPSCVKKKIKGIYPDPNGDYIGFISK